MPSLLGLADSVDSTFTQMINEGFILAANGKDIGLDERVGKVYIDLNDRLIIVHKSTQNKLNYYGGFEYVNDGHIVYLGQYIMYSAESDRVAKSIEIFEADMERKNNLADVDKS